MQVDYDIAIVGGGLAGLAASIQLSKRGYRVIVFEKDSYPAHKVCGEYVSLESWDFLTSLGLPLKELDLPIINTLILTAPNGKTLTTKLPLGGFGISRYQLDSSLAQIAINNGVTVLQNTKVDDVKFFDQYIISHSGQTIKARLCSLAYGKRSNLDVKWNRPFVQDQNARLNNYVGIKYHVKTDWPPNVIGLHNFQNGYCGISRIEDDKYCLCYMTKAENLKSSSGNIDQMQEKILFKNPHLKTIFKSADVLQNFPITISQISFSQKSKIENGMLMLGDSAGMITPLCGNGMSIALHTSKIATNLIADFLENKVSQNDLNNQYEKQWQQNFASRLKTGRLIQSFFGSNSLSNALVASFNFFPFLKTPLIKLTHGKPF
ncbi:MAG: NAD(P)/FAD-dependent oxidoreductase [Chitinophagaceae bacterium]|nr:MAG: NAD(P)/FAD-dependent oxidoreductase [Chitinophagaceae bacterium]